MRALSVLCACVLAALGPAARGFQEVAERDVDRTIERFTEYLSQRPFQDSAFARLVETAVEADRLGELVAGYEQRVEDDPGDFAGRVVLARLYARSRRGPEALQLLAGVEESSAELEHLRGTLLLEEGRVDEGIAALDAAAEMAEDPRLLEVVHEARGNAQLSAGRPEEAAAALRELAALRPGSFETRMRVAGLMERHGLDDDALEEYAQATRLAEADEGNGARQLCRALSATGRLLERRGEHDEAVAAYERALSLMSRDHWLKNQLLDALLAIHKRTGRLDDFVLQLEEEVAADPGDVDRRVLLARGLIAGRRFAEGRFVLEAAVADFPGDRGLSRRLVRCYEDARDKDAVVAELQRIAARYPEDLELLLELGYAFHSAGLSDRAREHWEEALGHAGDQRSFKLRVCDTLAAHGFYDSAIAALERLLEREPEAVELYTELAALQAAKGDNAALARVLDRAERSTRDDPGRLLAVAKLAESFEDLPRARRLLEAAHDLRPADGRIAMNLADLLVLLNETEAAGSCLRAVAAGAEEERVRSDAAERLVRMYAKAERSADLQVAEEARLARDPADRTALHLLALIELQGRRYASASARLESLVALSPESVSARESLASVYMRLGRIDDAVEEYRSLAGLRPQAAKEYERQTALAYSSVGRHEEAVGSYRRMLELAPDNVSVAIEVAGELLTQELRSEAAEVLEQVLRRVPDADRARLELARVYSASGKTAEAMELAREVARSGEAAMREEARGWIYQDLAETGRLVEELARLQEAIAASPHDDELLLALVDLHRREGEAEVALDLLGQVLDLRPRDTELLRVRAELYRDAELWRDALADYERVAEIERAESDRHLFDMARCAYELGDLARAERYLSRSSDLQRIALFYSSNGEPARALAVLERARRRAPSSVETLRQLARLHEKLDDGPAAIAALDRILDLRGDNWEDLRRRLRVSLEVEGEAEACTRRMIALLEFPTQPDPPPSREHKKALRRVEMQYAAKLREVLGIWQSGGRRGGFMDLAAQLSRERPNDKRLFSLAYTLMMREDRDPDGLLELVDDLQALAPSLEALPLGYTESSWSNYLRSRRNAAVRLSPTLSKRKASGLHDRIDELTKREIQDLLKIYVRRADEQLIETALREARVHHPEDLDFLAGHALVLYRTGDHPSAEELLKELVARCAEGPRRVSQPHREYDDDSHAGHRERIQRQLPEELHDDLDDGRLRILYALSRSCLLRDDWRVWRAPHVDEARLVLARCLSAMGKHDEARALLKSLEPPEPFFVETFAYLASVYVESGYEDEALRVARLVHDALLVAEGDPVLRHGVEGSRGFATVIGLLVEDLKSKDELLPAYILTRRFLGFEAARELVFRSAHRREVLEHLEAVHAGRTTDVSIGGSRNTLVMLLELHLREKNWDEACELLRPFLERDDEEGDIYLLLLAVIERRAERIDEAIAVHERAMEIRRARFEAGGSPSFGSMPQFQERPDPFALIPQVSRRIANDLELTSFSGWFLGRPKSGPYVADHQAELFSALLLAREYDRASKVLTELFDAYPQHRSMLSTFFSPSLRGVQVSKEALPVLRILAELPQANGRDILQYGSALQKTGKPTEAARIYRSFLRRAERDDPWRDSVQTALKQLED